MFFTRRGGAGGGGSAVDTRNILNGVLNCAWDKTSATPKLLEIYNTSFVKLNIDSDNPLVMAFANGWDDKDRPAQIIKSLAAAPCNIDLSGKANCHVQIVAKVINDELVITTHDIYDPALGDGVNFAPGFSSGYVDSSPMDVSTSWKSTKDGWEVFAETGPIYSTKYPRYAFVGMSNGMMTKTNFPADLNIRMPFAPVLSKVQVYVYDVPSTTVLQGFNDFTATWDNLAPSTSARKELTFTVTSIPVYQRIRIVQSPSGYEAMIMDVRLYERPTAKFFRGLNKVKDRSDVEQLWINLGYATVDGTGAITALTHYTDLRNNYPGGMRVEA